MTIRLAFRFDDPSPVSKHSVEISVLNELNKHRLPATFAVVPFRTRANQEFKFTDKSASHILSGLDSGRLEIALHGCMHIDTSGKEETGPSEFFGLTFERQSQLIHRGKKELERVFGPVLSGFVPPWNSYDEQTLLAACANGFSYVSADKRDPPNIHLPLLPATCKLDHIKSSVAEAQRFSSLKPVIIVVLHHYDFDRDNDDPLRSVYSYNQFGTLLDWIVEQPDLHVLALRDIADSMSGKKLYWPKHSRWRAKLPWRFRHCLPETCYATRSLLHKAFRV